MPDVLPVLGRKMVSGATQSVANFATPVLYLTLSVSTAKSKATLAADFISVYQMHAAGPQSSPARALAACSGRLSLPHVDPATTGACYDASAANGSLVPHSRPWIIGSIRLLCGTKRTLRAKSSKRSAGMLQPLQGFSAKYSSSRVSRRNPNECVGCAYKHARLDRRTSAAMKHFCPGQTQGECSTALSNG